MGDGIPTLLETVGPTQPRLMPVPILRGGHVAPQLSQGLPLRGCLPWAPFLQGKKWCLGGMQRFEVELWLGCRSFVLRLRALTVCGRCEAERAGPITQRPERSAVLSLGRILLGFSLCTYVVSPLPPPHLRVSRTWLHAGVGLRARAEAWRGRLARGLRPPPRGRRCPGVPLPPSRPR